MDESRSRQILEYVKPLCAGLDGATNFGNVERTLRACAAIGRDRGDLEQDRLFLLAVFSGQERWIGRFGNGTRTELFLASVGVPADEFRRLLRSLGRFRTEPSTPEEEVVHDAVRLEEIGAYGVARIGSTAARERMDFRELAAAIEQEASDDFRTPEGRRLAETRLGLMKEFAAQLRREVEAFEPE